MGLEFIYRGIELYNEPGMIVVFETNPDKLIRDATGFGWNLQEMQQQKKIQIIFASPQVLDQELRSPDSLLLEAADKMGAQRIFVDGIGLLGAGPVAGAPPRAGYRELLLQMMESLPPGESDGYRFPRTGRYGICKKISHFRRGNRIYRAPPRTKLQQPASSTMRSVIGVEAVDSLIGGGVFDGCTTMIVGVSGVGKTVLATQILREGPLQQNARGLLISLDEHPAQIMRNARTLGLDLEEQVAGGTIQILFESPQELDVDAHYARIVQLIEERDIRRMVIDGMTSYSSAIDEVSVYRDLFHAIVAYSKQRLMTTLFNHENPEFLRISSYMPDFPVSSIVDNLILMSMVEINNSLHRCVSVVKARGSKHSFDTREFLIGQGGISLVPLVQDRAVAKPLQSYSSLLGRAPTRFSLPKRTNGAAMSQGSE